MKLIMIMMMMMTSMMIFNYPPFMLVMIILIQTLLCSMMMWMMAESFWMAYILILIFLGGMLVIFIYMASINSNQKINFKFSMVKMNTMSMVLITLYVMSQMNSELLMGGAPHHKSLTNNINKMYESSSSMTTLIMAIYLMITLFILVMLSKKFKGPLKSN
uniref:NADH dehydrogenase subunit 6 n=1 Tax=Endeis sp. JZ-2022 TaxID=2992007 RepID=A0A9E8ADT7_9CHEL|nr:NADH dehydrogenase subunit 6 [Endeis sp. JZ-2022]